MTLAFLVVSAVGCGDSGPDLALGPTTKFRLARVHDGMNIGIDLEIRLPPDYRPSPGPFRRTWFRKGVKHALVIDVTTDPEDQETPELPCGEPQPNVAWMDSVAARIERPDDLTVVCEEHVGRELTGVTVVRLITSIGTVIQCKVHRWEGLESSEEREAELAICQSLRVRGRSLWTDDDWLLPEDKPVKPWQ